MNELSIAELYRMPDESYELIDIRDEELTMYGMIPGAISVSFEELQDGSCTKLEAIPKAKKLVFYCEIGRKTGDME